jgi:hypothetical protein
MRVLLVGDDPNDQNLHQKAAPFYNALHTVFGFELVAADSKDIGACGWRIVISPMIPQDFSSCYYSSMRNLAVLVIHLIATLARLLGPGGVRSLVAESLLLKHQLLIVNRSRQRSPNLSAGDRILAGLLALLVRPTRLLRSAIALKPSNVISVMPVRLSLIDDAEEKGIRVVCVSTDAPESKRSSIVCVEPWLNGCLAGELMGKFVPPGSKVAIVAGMLKTEDHRKKSDGFAEAFGRHCHGGKIVSVIEGHEDEDESFQKTFDLLRRFPAVAGIYVNTVNCLPVCRALGARGLAGKVKLITTDLFAEMAPYFQKGTISASIYQQPFRQGQLAVRLMADNLTNKIDFPPSVHLSPGVVMTSNLHIFREMRRSESRLNESVP